MSPERVSISLLFRLIIFGFVTVGCLHAASNATASPGVYVHPGVTYEHRSGLQDYGTGALAQEIYILYIDTTHPDVSFIATGPGHGPSTVSQFAAKTGSAVAINTNFYNTSNHAPIGMAMGYGQLVPTAEAGFSTSLAIGPGNQVSFPYTAHLGPAPEGAHEVCTGSGMLVFNGDVFNDTSTDRHPRTAACLHADGITLILAVVDGRAAGRTGMRLRTLALFMKSLGCHHAINLDGGGSSTMYIRGQPAYPGRSAGVVNRTSDGSERRVCCSFGAIITPCSPGKTHTARCERCGTRTRTCIASGVWGDWGPCTGQGECEAGASESRNCCDCGTQTRTCSSSCKWSDYSECSGPDPAGGTIACETGEPGPCNPGTQRCIKGCITCKRTYEPQPEICDDIDNDCSGEVDDGEPKQMSEPPPMFASEVLDSGFPALMHYGERGEAWMVLRNEGQNTWNNGQFWLEAESTWTGARSPLYDSSQWPAFNVAAWLDQAVEPGDTVVVRIPLLASELPKVSDGWYREAFHLVSTQGVVVKCPSARLAVNIRAISSKSRDGGVPSIGSDAAADVTGDDSPDGSALTGGCCAINPGHHRTQTPWWLMAAGIAITVFRRKVSSRLTRNTRHHSTVYSQNNSN